MFYHCFSFVLLHVLLLIHNSYTMQIWAESGKSALPICNYSQILYQFLTFTQNLKRSLLSRHFSCTRKFRWNSLVHKKARPANDAHSRDEEVCRKRPRSARECAKAHSFLWFLLPPSLYLWRADHRYSLVKQII